MAKHLKKKKKSFIVRCDNGGGVPGNNPFHVSKSSKSRNQGRTSSREEVFGNAGADALYSRLARK